MTPTQAEHLARRLHEDQTDKAGQPYHEHLLRVRYGAAKLARAHGLPEDEVAIIEQAALLHDAIEDTSATRESLLNAGVGERVIDLVSSLSRPTGPGSPSYAEWVQGIADSGDASLIIIKMADNRDNADPERLALLQESARGMARRYENAYKVLFAGLEAVKERTPGIGETNHPSP